MEVLDRESAFTVAVFTACEQLDLGVFQLPFLEEQARAIGAVVLENNDPVILEKRAEPLNLFLHPFQSGSDVTRQCSNHKTGLSGFLLTWLYLVLDKPGYFLIGYLVEGQIIELDKGVGIDARMREVVGRRGAVHIECGHKDKIHGDRIEYGEDRQKASKCGAGIQFTTSTSTTTAFRGQEKYKDNNTEHHGSALIPEKGQNEQDEQDPET